MSGPSRSLSSDLRADLGDVDPSPSAWSRKRRRYHLHHWRRHNRDRLLKGASTCLAPVPDAPLVPVHVGAGATHAVKKVIRCGSVWACPVCAPIVRERKAREIDQACQWAWSAGLEIWFITATVPHRDGTQLRQLRDQLQRMWSSMWSGRDGSDLGESIGLEHSIRAVETTWGDRNGWHPHIHALLICEPGRFDRAYVDADWEAQFIAEGFGHKWTPGVSVDCRPVVPVDRSSDAGAATIGQYLAKVEGMWGAGLELARADLKGRGGLKAEQLLELAAHGVPGSRPSGRAARYVALWREYEHATKGWRQLVWSPNLRASAGLGEERSDVELAAGDDVSDVVGLALVPAALWERFRVAGRLWELLCVVTSGAGEEWGVHVVRVAWSDSDVYVPPPRAPTAPAAVDHCLAVA